MKFNIIGFNDSFGKHRFSNNKILEILAKNSVPDDNLNFVWWIEKVFTDKKYKTDLEKLKNKPWFGVAHVPLLTPNWAMYAQNDLSSIYFSEHWGEAKKYCKGIICLSEHMSEQFKAFEPDLNVISLKHPIGKPDHEFNLNAFIDSPCLVLVGTWLRDYKWFCESEFGIPKKILMTHYAQDYLTNRYSKYYPDIIDKLNTLEVLDRLCNEQYDLLISSSLIFLGMHETSANNALCECIAMNVPFVANKHPALVEYVGEDYPLFAKPGKSFNITISMVRDAHLYLKNNHFLKLNLEYNTFLNEFRKAYNNFIFGVGSL